MHRRSEILAMTVCQERNHGGSPEQFYESLIRHSSTSMGLM